MILPTEAQSTAPVQNAIPSGTEVSAGAMLYSWSNNSPIPLNATAEPATNLGLIGMPRKIRASPALGTSSNAKKTATNPEVR